MAQINLKKTATPETPATDRMGLYFDDNGDPYKVDESGTTSPLGGAQDFTDLGDVPSSYTGEGGKVVKVNGAETGLEFGTAGAGDVVGPASSTDNAIARFDGASGESIQNSGVTIDDSDNLSGVNNTTGDDANFVTGTAGTSGNLLEWDANGDAVDSGVVADDVLTVVPDEEEIVGTATYDATNTGTVNLDLETFSAHYMILTGNTTITVSNTPASGESFVRSLKIESDTTETLTLPVSWNVVGTYAADGTVNDLQIEFSNFPTEGLVVWCYINQPS